MHGPDELEDRAGALPSSRKDRNGTRESAYSRAPMLHLPAGFTFSVKMELTSLPFSVSSMPPTKPPMRV